MESDSARQQFSDSCVKVLVEVLYNNIKGLITMKKLIAAIIAATFSFGSAFAQNAAPAAPDAPVAAPAKAKKTKHKKSKKAKHKKSKKAAAQ